MHNNKKLKATITYLIVALLFVAILLGSTQAVFGKQLREAISLANMVSTNTANKVLSEIKFDSVSKRLQQYPEYGMKYATMEIPSLEMNFPVYFGDTLSILRKGIGQSSGAYFPGEGGSVVCMGHNTKAFLRDLPDIQNGANIKITTTYGEFNYEVYETKIVHQTDLEAVPIQQEEEILMLYTCYPTNSIGHATKRFVVYAKLV